jgi:hypothetical protein
MLVPHPVRTVALLGVFVFGGLACSSEGAPPAKSPANQAEGSKTVAASDTDACNKICEASRACGDSTEECAHKCNSWLVERSRTGIARQTATCAVPRIENACAKDASRGAARALVNCVDDAGRTALSKDKKSLVVAAHAICARGARCGGGSQGDAAACVEKIMSSSPMPRGLGIFGATRPEIVKDFASCMDASPCDGSPAVCFAGMMGEEVMDGEDVEPPAQSTPAPSSSSSSGGPDTKI